jgi:D-alanyl-D-alanine dipeptidase
MMQVARYRRPGSWSVAAVLLTILSLGVPASGRDMLPPGFVYLRDIAPDIAQDIRYATSDNFTGRPLPGYGAAECVLRRETAEALRRVEADLAPDSLGLKVYDCYRPTRAVRAMAAWSRDGSNAEQTKRFYPALNKRDLFALGYIASQSRHSTGTTVDLTLIKLPAQTVLRFDPTAHYGSCAGPVSRRAPDNSIDMGTSFDCFDVRSHGASSALAPEQRHWRRVLQMAMRHRGFSSYFREWWHYSFSGAADPRDYDFAISPRGR